ncbi:hypothetical protein [Acidithiobacillus sulfuriphilus]|uniref:hypothetical protein n=1 Tax=Acidithiobacillus sulfuriphilus TaxID=1867749 RepID=UPI003F5F1F76
MGLCKLSRMSCFACGELHAPFAAVFHQLIGAVEGGGVCRHPPGANAEAIDGGLAGEDALDFVFVQIAAGEDGELGKAGGVASSMIFAITWVLTTYLAATARSAFP